MIERATTLVTAATAKAVTLAEVKKHLRVDHDDEDGDIQLKLDAAVDYVEQICGRALVSSTWDLWLQEFPACDYIEIPKGQLTGITSLKYTDSAAAQTTWTSTNYEMDAKREPGRLVLAYGKTWPSATLRASNPIEIRFVAGWATPEVVPASIKSAILLLAGHWYENREAVVVESPIVPRQMALAVDHLLAPYRLWREQ